MTHPFPSQTHKDLYLATLRMLGVKQVKVSFSGSGDSGTINTIEFYNSDDDAVPNMQDTVLVWPKSWDEFDRDTRTWVQKKEEAEQDLYSITSDITYKALDRSGLDWYNNEGGQGAFSIDFTKTPVHIELYVGVNYTTTTDHNFTYSDEE